MLVDKVYSAVSLLVNKDQLSGYLPPDEFNKYAEFAQREFIDLKYSPLQGMGYESTYKMTDELSPVKKQTSLTITNGITVNSAGSATIPSDYLHFSAARGTFIFGDEGKVVPIELVRDDEWAERLASEVNKPSKRFPILRQMDGYFEVYPQDINNITLSYLKVPLEPWWNYTLSGSTPTFAETGGTTTNPNAGVTAGDSTDFEIQDFKFLVYRICQHFGTEVREADIYQVAKQQEAG